MREYRRKGAIGLIELDSVALARAVGAEHRAARAGHDRYAVVADHRSQLHHVIEIPKARRRLGLSGTIGVLERHANNLSREGGGLQVSRRYGAGHRPRHSKHETPGRRRDRNSGIGAAWAAWVRRLVRQTRSDFSECARISIFGRSVWKNPVTSERRVVETTGIEPVTFPMSRECTTAVLRLLNDRHQVRRT